MYIFFEILKIVFANYLVFKENIYHFFPSTLLFLYSYYLYEKEETEGLVISAVALLLLFDST